MGITDMLTSELVSQQHAILNFALDHYEEEIKEELEGFPLDDMPEEAAMLMTHHGALWRIFCDSDDKPSVIKEYLNTYGASIKRPRVREMVESWDAGFPALYQVTQKISSTHFLGKDIISNKEFPITLLEEREFFEQDLLFGIFVPHEASFTIFVEVLNFEREEAPRVEQAIHKLYEEAEEDPESFYKDWFIEIVETLVFGSIDEAIEDLEWENEQHQSVAAILKQELELKGVPDTLIRLGVTLWYSFCQQNPPVRIQKPMVYVAALHYMVDSHTNPFEITKNRYVKEYGVSASGLATKIRELENTLAEELDSLRELVEVWDEDEDLFDLDDHEFDFPRDEYLLTDPKRIPAQDLIYKAFEEKSSTKRKKLAEEALSIYSNCADAYVILGEEERDIQKKLSLFEQGLLAGTRDLGERFFQQNKGHFWGFHESRPYMRAKLKLAMLLLETDETDEAIIHLEELLDLNPNDNQGVRYTLVQAYFMEGMYVNAEDIFEQFDIDDAHAAFGRLFIHYKNKGITKQLEKFKKRAIEANPNVLPYLLKQKKLPKEQSAFVGFRDESEAISYVLDFGPFWWGEKELLEWLGR